MVISKQHHDEAKTISHQNQYVACGVNNANENLHQLNDHLNTDWPSNVRKIEKEPLPNHIKTLKIAI